MAAFCSAVNGAVWEYTAQSANSVYDADALCPGAPLMLDRATMDDFFAVKVFPVQSDVGNLQSSVSDLWTALGGAQTDLQNVNTYAGDLEVRIASLEAQVAALGGGGGGGGSAVSWLTEMTPEQGALIAGAILLVWAVAWAARQIARVINLDEGESNA